jgi:hypothetical protein
MFALAVSAQVRNNEAVLLGQHGNLLSPCKPSLGPSVNEDDGRSSRRPGKNVMHVDAVHKGAAVLESRGLRKILY